jgi:hypothetical protein
VRTELAIDVVMIAFAEEVKVEGGDWGKRHWQMVLE